MAAQVLCCPNHGLRLQAWCLSESDSDFEMLEKRLEALTPDESILVRRSD